MKVKTHTMTWRLKEVLEKIMAEKYQLMLNQNLSRMRDCSERGSNFKEKKVSNKDIPMLS